jgi:MFS family permease
MNDNNDVSPNTKTLASRVVPLLAFAFFINYVDRGNLATAAPLIQDQLHLSNTQMGLLLSAFFWSYVPAQLVAGWMADHLNPYRTFAAGLALWSIATAACGLATGFVSLFALRVILGFGESTAFPCSAKLFTQILPSHKLGAANGLVGVGMALGPACGTFFGGLLMTTLGWRGLFLLVGVGSLFWLIPWHAATRGAYVRQPVAQSHGPSFVSLLRRRELWGASLGHFCGNYSFYFVISWLPLYLVKARGFSVVEMAKLGGLIFLVYALSSFLVGRVSDRWIAAGATDNRVRKTMVVVAHLGMAASLVIAAIGDTAVAIGCLFCAAVSFGFFTPTLYSIGQTLAGPTASGKWIGVQGCIANIAGIIAPIVTGMVVDKSGQYYWAFVIAAAVSVVGIVGWTGFIKRVESLRWEEPGLPSGAALRTGLS